MRLLTNITTSSYGNMPLYAVIFMFDYTKVLMIMFARSNCYSLQLIVTKYIWAELIFYFLLIYYE